MVQRIQTIYLLSSAIAILALIFLPLAEIAGPESEFIMTAGRVWESNKQDAAPFLHINFLPLFGLILLEVIFSMVIIFLYKKRTRQMMLGKLNLLVLTALIATVFFYADYAKTLTGLPKDTLVNYTFACLLPVIAIILNYLAIRSIKKDEELVRAADRLR